MSFTSFYFGLFIHGKAHIGHLDFGGRWNLAYMQEGAGFNGTKNIMPDEYFRTLVAGDVLNNEQQNSLLCSTR